MPEVKQGVICPKCKTIYPKDARRCPKCGEKNPISEERPVIESALFLW